MHLRLAAPPRCDARHLQRLAEQRLGKARQERAKNRRLDQTSYQVNWRSRHCRSAPTCNKPAVPCAPASAISSGSRCSLFGRRSRTLTGDSSAKLFRYKRLRRTAKIARFGKRVAQVASQKRIFEVIDAAGRLAEQHDARFVVVLGRESSKLLLHGDEIRREPFDAALARDVGQHSRYRDAIFQRKAGAARAFACDRPAPTSGHRERGQDRPHRTPACALFGAPGPRQNGKRNPGWRYRISGGRMPSRTSRCGPNKSRRTRSSNVARCFSDASTVRHSSAGMISGSPSNSHGRRRAAGSPRSG